MPLVPGKVTVPAPVMFPVLALVPVEPPIGEPGQAETDPGQPESQAVLAMAGTAITEPTVSAAPAIIAPSIVRLTTPEFFVFFTFFPVIVSSRTGCVPLTAASGQPCAL